MLRRLYLRSGKAFGRMPHKTTTEHPSPKIYEYGVHTSSSSVKRNSLHIECFSSLGLSEKQSSEILANFTEISSCSSEKLQIAVDSLMKCQLGPSELVTLVVRHPYLLMMDPSVIEITFQNLLSLVPKYKVYELLLNAPNVLNDPWSVTEEKFKYLENVMLFSQSEIVKSGALNHTLHHIRMRHSFLSKVGVFKKLSPKLMLQERQKINPRLNDILNSTDSEFATKLAGVTKLEFEVYQQLFTPDEEIY